VRAFTRSMDSANDRVLIAVRLIAPRGRDDGGLRDAAITGLSSPASSRFTPAQLRSFIDHHGLALSVTSRPDGVVLRLTLKAHAFDQAMKLLRELLTGARVDAGPFAAWQASNSDAARAARENSVPGQLERSTSEALQGEVSNDGPQTPPTLADAQRELARLLGQAPMDVAVVGEIPAEIMLDRVARTFAGVEDRAPIAGPPEARAKPVAGPIVKTAAIPGKTAASVRLGWSGPAPEQIAERRAVRAALRIISTRLVAELREKRGLTYAIEARLQGLAENPRRTWIGTTFEVPPAQTRPALAAARGIFLEFARKGPSAAEMKAALAGLDNDIGRAEASAEYWLGALTSPEAGPVALAETERAREANAALTGVAVQKRLAQFLTDRGQFEIVVAP
jgi:hypothetical protein